MNEEQAVAKWLDSTLTADAAVLAAVAGRIYESLAPQGKPLPYVVYQLQGGTDTVAAGADRRIITRTLVTVKVIGEGGSYSGADTVYAAVDAAISGGSGQVTISGQDYWVAACYRTEPLRYVEVDAGKRLNHSGGIYRITAQALP